MENMAIANMIVAPQAAGAAAAVDPAVGVNSSGVVGGTTAGGGFGALLAKQIRMVPHQAALVDGLHVLPSKDSGEIAVPALARKGDVGNFLVTGTRQSSRTEPVADAPAIEAAQSQEASQPRVDALVIEAKSPHADRAANKALASAKGDQSQVASGLPDEMLQFIQPMLPAQPQVQKSGPLPEVVVDDKAGGDSRSGSQKNAVAGDALATIGSGQDAVAVEDVAADGGKKLPGEASGRRTAGDAMSDKADAGNGVVLPWAVAQAAPQSMHQPELSVSSPANRGQGVVSVSTEDRLQGKAGTVQPELPIQSSVPAPAIESQAQFGMVLADKLNAGADVSVASPSLPVLNIQQRVDSAQWSNGLGDKVVWMVGSQNQGAQLHLNPPALGPLEVHVSVSDGQASLTFTTQHAPVREAIEAATPRLREMLGDSGISLGSVSVNVGSFAQQQSPSREQASQSPGWIRQAGEDEDMPAVQPVAVSVRALRDGGMVDLFA